jgi:WD40 repeat protein
MATTHLLLHIYHAHTYTHIHKHTHTHAYTYTYTHIQIHIHYQTGRKINAFPILDETNMLSEQSQINSLAFNHNGNMLLTGGSDGTVRVFDTITSQCIMRWPGA